MEGRWQDGGEVAGWREVEGGGCGLTSARPLALQSRVFLLSLSIFSITMVTLQGWMPTSTVAPLASDVLVEVVILVVDSSRGLGFVEFVGFVERWLGPGRDVWGRG